MAMLQLLFTDVITLSDKRPKGYAILRPSAKELQIYARCGIIPPISVKPDRQDGFDLVQGEKHWMLAQMLGVDRIPGLVIPSLTRDDVKALIMLDLQSHGAKADPITEAESLQQLLDDKTYKSQAELARHLGMHRSAVHHKLQLLKLDPEVKASLSRNDSLSPLHVRTLPSLPAEVQRALVRCMLSEGLSAHQSNRLAAIYRENWKQLDADGVCPELLTEQAFQALRKSEDSRGADKAAPVPVATDDGTDEGTYNALLNLLESERNLTPHNDIDVAALEQTISDKVGYTCRIQVLPSGAGEYAFRYQDGMGDYLQDDLEILLGSHYRVRRVDKENKSNGWACVLFLNGAEANNIADRLLC